MEITTRLECNTVRNPQNGPPSPSFRPFPRQENNTMDVDAIRKKLTEQERNMLRAQRGCFYCRKTNVNHLASNCPEKNTAQGNALATLTAQVAALTEVLANANKGLSPYFSRSRPFVACTVANTAIPALIDTGSDLNVINPKVVKQLKIPTYRIPPLTLKFANEQTQQTTELAIIDTTIGTCTQTIPAVVAPIAEAIILGTPWTNTIKISNLQTSAGQLTFQDQSKAQIHEVRLLPAQSFSKQTSLVRAVSAKDGSVLVSPSSTELDAATRIVDGGAALTERDKVLPPETNLVSTEVIIDLENDESKLEAEYSSTVKNLPTELRTVLHIYKNLFKKPKLLPPNRPENHKIELMHRNVPNRWRPLRRQDDIEARYMKNQISEMLTRGYVEPSNSPWGAAAFMVDKHDGGKRMVIDYRDLNSHTVKDATPMPNIHDLRNKVRGKKFFTKLDARDGFYNILIDPQSRKYTGFRTPFGMFEFNVLPMGLCNSPATFMRMMNRIFGDLYDKFLVVYMDDLLIHSETEEEHIKHITEILRRFKDNQLHLKLSKCLFMKSEVHFCGLNVSNQGISIDPLKAESVLALYGPMTRVRDIQRFLGLTNWFKDFIPDYADICLPLTKLLKKNSVWHYGIDEHSTVLVLIFHILSASTLAYFEPGQTLYCYTDASEYAIGGFLGQIRNGTLKPIVFWSRKLIPAELNYLVTEKECLALVAMIKKFHFYFQTGP
jgi:hypothetical protein